MQIDLNREEAHELRTMLESYLRDMHDEIHYTDDHDFRERLKARRELLRQVLQRLPVGK